MTTHLEWTLHLTTDAQGQPEFAWLSVCDDQDFAHRWVADADFAPFDTMLAAGVWLGRMVRTHAASALR